MNGNGSGQRGASPSQISENNILSISKKYKKIDTGNFIALCPNCHKKVHEQMVQQSFIDRECGYQGFDDGSLSSGWNVEYFGELID